MLKYYCGPRSPDAAAMLACLSHPGQLIDLFQTCFSLYCVLQTSLERAIVARDNSKRFKGVEVNVMAEGNQETKSTWRIKDSLDPDQVALPNRVRVKAQMNPGDRTGSVAER